MQHPIRRVVTGLAADGRSRVTSDVALEPLHVGHDLILWRTDSTPADVGGPDDTAQGPHRLEPPPTGSVLRIVEFPPASALAGLSAAELESFFAGLFDAMGARHCRVDTRRSPGMHTTATLDYVIVLEGEITLLLDDGETTLRAGDVAVQRATNHDWINRGDAPALLAVVMLDARR